MHKKEPDDLLTTSEAAYRLRLSVSTLNKMRGRPGGPRYVKVGKRLVRYPPKELDAWEGAQLRRATWEYTRRKKPPPDPQAPDPQTPAPEPPDPRPRDRRPHLWPPWLGVRRFLRRLGRETSPQGRKRLPGALRARCGG